ncbi:MAG: QueT transporter family protein [Streptococcaceae bacterium]|jgi:uncharacterized membrane protein|nr:QueT transporter family protein [Streptococcaceae bacterium]
METHLENHTKTNALTKAAIVTGLYISLTLLLAPISYGMIQIRFSEMFNHLIHYNKHYLWSVTLGVFIANAYSFGAVDMIVGSFTTLVFLSLSLKLNKSIEDMRKKQLITSLLMSVSMFTIALELKILNIDNHSFWIIFLTMTLGELLSMTLGGIIIRLIANKIDLVK